jgi:hypothetical protein
LIILDRAEIPGYDGRIHRLTFHIPLRQTTLIVVPSSIDKYTLARIIAGREKLSEGIIKYEVKGKIYTSIYLPDYSNDYVRIYELLSDLRKDLVDEILRICSGLGFELREDIILADVPRPYKELIGILYTLYSPSNISILVEPFVEFDDIFLSLLANEFEKLVMGDKTIVVITSNTSYLWHKIDLYDYAIVVGNDDSITSGDRDRFKGREILRNTYTYEVAGDPVFLKELVEQPGVKGYVRISKNAYWVFVERGYRYSIARFLERIYREKKILRYRFIGYQRIRGM